MRRAKPSGPLNLPGLTQALGGIGILQAHGLLFQGLVTGFTGAAWLSVQKRKRHSGLQPHYSCVKELPVKLFLRPRGHCLLRDLVSARKKELGGELVPPSPRAIPLSKRFRAPTPKGLEEVTNTLLQALIGQTWDMRHCS